VRRSTGARSTTGASFERTARLRAVRDHSLDQSLSKPARSPTGLRMRLRDLAGSRTRYGYRRLTVLLRREGWVVNAKRVYRLYRAEQLQVQTKKRTKAYWSPYTHKFSSGLFSKV